MKVASLVHNNFISDSRVQKQAISLANAGYDLTVFALWKKGISQEEFIDGYKIQRYRIYCFINGTFGKFFKIFSVFSQDVLADKTNGYYSLPRLPPVTCNAYFQVLFQIKISCDL